MVSYVLVMLAAVLSAACDEPVDPTLPTDEEIEAYYEYEGRLDGELTGNVALVTSGVVR